MIRCENSFISAIHRTIYMIKQNPWILYHILYGFILAINPDNQT